MIYDLGMGNASTEFDPYNQWLGIGPHEQPADHYRLLGIDRFESRPEVIQAAADQRMTLVRKFQLGPKGDYTQGLLNELSAAKLTLLDPTARIAYDRMLRETAVVASASATHAATPIAIQEPWPIGTSQGIHPTPTSSDGTREIGDDAMSVIVIATAPLTSPASDQAEDPELPVYMQPWFLVLIATMLVAVGGLALGLNVMMERRGAGQSPLTTATDGPGTPPDANPADLAESPEALDEPPVLVYQEADGAVNLVASTARLRGDLQLGTHEDQSMITGWTSTDGSATWRFSVLKPGIYRVRLIYAVTEDAQGRSFAIDVVADGREAVADSLRHTVSMRGGPGVTIEDEDHLRIRRSGENTLAVWTSTPTPQGLMQLRAIRLLPPGRD